MRGLAHWYIWRLPRWLDARLPDVDIEGSTARKQPEPGGLAIDDTAELESARTEA